MDGCKWRAAKSRLTAVALAEGDGAAISDEEKVTIVANSPAEVLFFDLA